MSLSERLARLRNFQSRDFWAMVFARPLTILILLALAEKSWVTPNRITTLAMILKGLGAYLIAFEPTEISGIWAAILVNLGLVCDNMDGTLARYRQNGTLWGFYYDKLSDAVTLVLLFWAMAFRAFNISHNILDIVLPLVGVCGAMTAGYAKWVAERVCSDSELKQIIKTPERFSDWVQKHTKHDNIVEPPRRNFVDWLKWLGWALFSILFVNEVDLFFWIAVALLSGEMWIFSRVISSLVALGLLVGPLFFAIKVRRLAVEQSR